MSAGASTPDAELTAKISPTCQEAAGADLPLALRGMRQADIAFVVSTWAQSVGDPQLMARGEWLSNMRLSAQTTMLRAKRVMVLVSSEHEGTILGWACGDDGVVHHAYVRPAMRKASGQEWVAKLLRAAKGES